MNTLLKAFFISASALALAMLSAPASAAETAQTFAYQGRLLNSAGTGPLTGLADIKFEILNLGKDCVLYAETQNVDLGSVGAFAVQVGSVVGSGKRAANDAGLSMAQVFTTSGSITGRKVSDGTNCTYAPAAGDLRYLRVTVTPQAGSAITLDPDQVVGAVPQSIVAETVQGKTPLEFVQVTGNGSTAYSLSKTDLDKIFAAGDAQGLHHHDNEYVKIGGATSVGDFSLGSGKYLGLGSHLSDPAFSSGDAGKIWYNSATKELKFNDGTAIRTMPVGPFEAPLTFSGDFNRTGNTIGLNGLDAAKVTSGVFGTARLGTGTADNSTFLRGDGVWVAPSASDSTKLPLTGGTLSGALNLGGNSLQGAAGASGTLTLDSTSHATKGSIFLNPSGGNVGIGTTSPQFQLDVAGDVNVTGHFKLNGAELSVAAGSSVPPSTVIGMHSCPAGWTSQGDVVTTTLSLLMCQSPATTSMIPANTVVYMEACPSGWTRSSSGGALNQGFVKRNGVSYFGCQSPAVDSLLPPGVRVIGLNSCAASWTQIAGSFDVDSAANWDGAVGTGVTCEVPGKFYLHAIEGEKGTGTLVGGTASIAGGAASSGTGGKVNIIGGQSQDGSGGSVFINGANGVTATATARVGGGVTIRGGAGVAGGVGGSVSLQAGNDGSTNYSSLTLQASGGNVGIGTPSPDTKLHIAGTPGVDGIKFPDGTVQTSAVSASPKNAAILHNAGSCSVITQSGSWITAANHIADGQCDLTVASGTFTGDPVCVCARRGNAVAVCGVEVSGSTITVKTAMSFNVTPSDYSFNLICM